MKYPLSIPYIGEDKIEIRYILDAMDNNELAVGDALSKFEAAVGCRVGIDNCLAVVNGTSAIHLALLSLGVTTNDHVCTSTLTFIGSTAPISYVGATPIFIESDEQSWNIDPNMLGHYFKSCAILPKALILTHLYGQPADLESISLLCEKYGVALIEDAAESLGAKYAGRESGTFGKCGIFSFNGNKIITSGGGGVLVSDDSKLIERARYFSSQARERVSHYEHLNIGYNYRMSNLIAAVGLAQFEKLDWHIEQRQKIFKSYENFFAGDDRISFMPQLEKAEGNRWLTTALLNSDEPERVISELAKFGIECRRVWKPMHMQPVYEGCGSFLNGTAENLFDRGICLPSCSFYSEDDINFISEKISETLR